MAKVVVGATLSLENAQALESVGKVKQAFREAQKEMVAMQGKFGEFSQEALTAAKYVAQLKDRIGDAKELVAAFNPDRKFAAFSQSINGVVGGFSALQGSMALFGVKSEDVEKTLLKVQAAMALSQGLNQVNASIDGFKNLATVVKSSTLFIKLNSIATEAATAAQRLFGISVDATSVSFRVLKGAIAATGIGVLIILIGEAVSFFNDLASAAEKAAEAEKTALDLRTKYAAIGNKGELEFIESQKKLDLAKAKARGASEKELFEIEQGWQNTKIKSLQRYHDEVKGDDIKELDSAREIQKAKNEMEISGLDHKTKIHEKESTEAKAHRAKMLAEEIAAEKKRHDELEKIRIDMMKLGKVDTAGPNDLKKEREKTPEELKYEEQTKGLVALAKMRNNEMLGQELNKTEMERQFKEARVEIANAEHDAKVDLMHDIGSAGDALMNLIGQQTGVGKALGIATATINTWVGVTEVIRAKSLLPEPLATISKVANITAIVASGLGAVKNILKVKVPSGGGGSAGGGAGASAPLTPQLSTQSTQLAGVRDQINNLGNGAMRAFVVESDITNNQERITRINRAARIGG